jgi:hypothetical protein|nr:MAG TPA: hypothetical protein [Caudoviricetes sp.]
MNEIDKIEKLSKPLIELLKENYHPHVTLEINVDGIKIKEDILYLPVKNQG